MLLKYLLLLVYFVVFSKTSEECHNNYEILDIVKRGFDEYLITKVRPAYLNEALSLLQIPHFFREKVKIGNAALTDVHKLENGVLCGLCNTAANYLVTLRKSGVDNAKIKTEVQALCEILRIENDRVCEGTINSNADIILYILDNNPDIQPGKFCDIMLQEFKCNYTNINWTVDLPEGESPTRLWETDSSSTFKILHVTDVHMDSLYTPGKVKKCNEPLCCQNDQDDGTEGNSCGFWAEYGNDVSENLIDEMIRFGNTLDLDFVYFTGDIISHRVWSTTEEKNSATIDKFLKKLKNGFSVPVYPTLGNHEPSPLNQFAYDFSVPTNLSTTWLFDLIEQEWSQWLPDSAMNTISRGGFYTVSLKEGFRLIVLNSNVAYRGCWWLLQHDEDPYEQLDWLISILSQAEANGESVHILGHVPTGCNDVLNVWGREYNKIINRFANTITGQFNGHVHVDTFQIYYNSSDPNQAINVAWNGASLVPYDNANPSFKVYTVDKDTFNILDIDQWTFNLTLANENADQYPAWYKIYSFKDAFNVSSLQPKEIGDLLVNMARNHSRLAEYHLYRFKNSDIAIKAGCNNDCQKDYLCELSTSVNGETTQCDYLKQIYDENL